MTDNQPRMKVIGAKMPKWRCHKVVSADEIIKIYGDTPTDDWVMELKEGGVMYAPPEFFARGMAQVGDYVVVYEDGYVSWSPKEVFEKGYAKIG